MTARYVRLALVVASTLLIVGSGAVSTVNADRAVEVAVAPDGLAFLGVEASPVELDNGAHGPIGNGTPGGARADVALLTLTNRFGQQIEDVTVEPTNAHLGDSNTPPNVIGTSLSAPASLGPGESTAVTARVVCSNANQNEEQWEFHVVVQGNSFTVEMTETVTIRCTGDPPAEPPGQSGGRSENP